MPTTKLVLTTWLDTTNPTDGLTITPTFHSSLGIDHEALCNDLLTAWNSWMGATVQGTQQRCTAYDWPGTKPNYPKAQVTRFTDVAKPSPQPRETALCLSFYNDYNRPRYRGRLYIPMCLTGTTATASSATAPQRQKIADLVPIFTGLGGVDMDWGVYSKADNTFRKATNWFIDDAWDTQRRRGKKATARQTGTTSE